MCGCDSVRLSSFRVLSRLLWPEMCREEIVVNGAFHNFTGYGRVVNFRSCAWVSSPNKGVNAKWHTQGSLSSGYGGVTSAGLAWDPEGYGSFRFRFEASGQVLRRSFRQRDQCPGCWSLPGRKFRTRWRLMMPGFIILSVRELVPARGAGWGAIDRSYFQGIKIQHFPSIRGSVIFNRFRNKPIFARNNILDDVIERESGAGLTNKGESAPLSGLIIIRFRNSCQDQRLR